MARKLWRQSNAGQAIIAAHTFIDHQHISTIKCRAPVGVTYLSSCTLQGFVCRECAHLLCLSGV